jgi:hypothetical protein
VSPRWCDPVPVQYALDSGAYGVSRGAMQMLEAVRRR